METLKGVFPTPKATPKRDFLKENVMRLKLMKKNQNLQKIPTTVVPPIVKGPLPLKSGQRLPTRTAVLRESSELNSRDGNKKLLTTIKAPTHKFRKMPSETSLSALILSSNIKKLNASKNRDNFCQTMDTTDELFLKDVIIKYPSAVVLESIRTARSTATSRKTNKFDDLTLNLKELGSGDKTTYKHNYIDTHSKLVSDNINKLNEYMNTGTIKKKYTKSSNEKVIPEIKRNIKKILRNNKFNKIQNDENSMERFIDTPITQETATPTETTTIYDADDLNDNHSLETANNVNNYGEYNDNKIALDDSDYIETFEDRSSFGNNLKLKKKEPKLELPPSYRIGKVPKYLRTRKEELIKIAEKEKELVDCPEGHVILSEHDRKEALKIAKKKFNDLVDELNKMPMTAETMKLRNRKIEIEKELDLLENNIKIFSRKKVYVKIEE